MPSVRPFQFTGLPRYSAAQVAVSESLATYLSYRPFTADFAASMAGMLERYLKVPFGFGDVERRPIARSALPTLLPQVGCLLCVGAAPTEHKILVDLDPALASFAIERLLGGKGDSSRVQRPLTEIEQGVLSFVILHVLEQFQNGLHNGRELALTLDRFASSPQELQDVVDAEGGYQMLGVRLSAGKRIGYLRILIPDSLVQRSFASPVPQGGSNELERTRMRRRLDSLGAAEVRGRVQIAPLDLQPDDLADLEAGDIIIVENHQLTYGAEGFEGLVFIKLGAGKNGGLRARLFHDNNQSRLRIEEIVIAEQPLEEPMVQDGEGDAAAADEVPMESAPGPSDNLEETEGLLRDVEAPVVVELGRIRMNTAQVVRLRQGQILRLPRGPNDPVDLVVNGKLFARGELIEVDGELGVRLVQVVGG